MVRARTPYTTAGIAMAMNIQRHAALAGRGLVVGDIGRLAGE
jgi:hypothetical protein